MCALEFQATHAFQLVFLWEVHRERTSTHQRLFLMPLRCLHQATLRVFRLRFLPSIFAATILASISTESKVLLFVLNMRITCTIFVMFRLPRSFPMCRFPMTDLWLLVVVVTIPLKLSKSPRRVHTVTTKRFLFADLLPARMGSASAVIKSPAQRPVRIQQAAGSVNSLFVRRSCCYVPNIHVKCQRENKKKWAELVEACRSI
jgi:hypothetical protein